VDDELELIECDKCNGKGYIESETVVERTDGLVWKSTHIQTCFKCMGERKLDWVERIVGVNPEKGKIKVLVSGKHEW